MIRLPDPRGDVSQALLAALVRHPHTLAATGAPMPPDPLSDEDLQLALYLCYELHYLDRIPGVTLATVNLMSLLGLHRRWRGALVGHLALFEMSSSVPNRRYGNGLRRLGCDRETTDFFDEHVTADAVHEAIAAVDLAGGLVRRDPALAADVIWGARALVELEGRFARRLLDAWAQGGSSLLERLVSA